MVGVTEAQALNNYVTQQTVRVRVRLPPPMHYIAADRPMHY